MAFALPALFATMATTAAAGATYATVAGVSRARSATKKAKGQAEQATRVRAEELAKVKPLAAEAEALPEKAKTEAASIAAGRRRKRATLVTGPRGLLTEPTVTRPALLGA